MGNNIIVTFSIFFKFCCTIFTSGIMFRILIMHVKFGAKTAKTYFAEKKNKTNECHEFILSSDGGKCSAISWSQGSSVLQTKWSWTNDDVLVKMLCKRMKSWTPNFNLNNSILVSFDINLDIFYFQWLSSALLLFLMTFHLLFKAQNGGKQLWRGKLPNLPDSLIKIKLGIFSVTSV